MRKILSKKEEEKRTRRNQWIIGGVLVLIMVASALGYAFGREQESNEKIIYNGFEFQKKSGLWNVNIGNFQFYFMYNPKEIDKINSVLNPLSSYYGKPLYIYSENSEALIEIYRNLFYQNQIVERVQEACLKGEKCDSNAPIKTCENNFIIIKESNATSIRQDNNCVFIEGNFQDLTKLSDGFLFKIIGIMQ
jgi:hypothetical protein